MIFPPLESDLIDTLKQIFSVEVKQIELLPIGADANSTVYKTEDLNGRPLFLKLRRGEFNEPSVTVPGYLSQMGVAQIIPPVKTNAGQLWVDGPDYKLLLAAYVDGKNGYETDLTASHWNDFGAALKKIHGTKLSDELKTTVRRETYPAEGRDGVLGFLDMAQNRSFEDQISQEVAKLLTDKRDEIETLVSRASSLAPTLQTQADEFVICHADLHAGNLLIRENDQALFIIDWDELILAPKERDLMSVGGSLLASGLDWQTEENLFYEGYGRSEINRHAVAYYRYERIIQDIFAYCKELLVSAEGSREERRESLAYLKSNFEPLATIAAADRAWELI